MQNLMIMKISNRVKRNISLALLVVGVLCILARSWEVLMAPSSGRAWFELFGIVVITFLCVDNYLIYSRKVKRGIKFGSF